MKIIKVNSCGKNAQDAIKESMNSEEAIAILSTLDACGCTGNGFC